MSLLDKATIITTPTAHSNGKLHSIKGGAVADFNVVRGSVATRVASNGLIESVATNIPRLDYTTGEGVILTEPQSTNLIPYSEDFSQWVNSSTTLTNELTSPSGDNSAYSLLSGSGASDRLSFVTSLSSVNTEHTISVFVKQVGGFNTAYLRWGHSELANNIVTFAFDTETLTNVSGNSTDLFADNYGNGWYRIGFTFTTGSGISNQQLQINRGADASAAYWGAQVEEKSYATSYIPTSGAIATRLADSLTGAGDSSTFNSAEGVLYFEFKPINTDTYTFSISDGGAGNFTQLYVQNGGNNVRYRVSSGGVVQFDNNVATAVNLTLNNRYALKWKANNFSLWLNGTKINSQTAGLAPIGLNQIDFNSVFTFTGQEVYGKTKTIAVFSEALTDAELTCLTTI